MKKAFLSLFLTATVSFIAFAQGNGGIPEIEMVKVDGGTFKMGSVKGAEDEKPVHTVTVKSFRMSRFEITQAQYTAVMKKNPSKANGCPDCPVNIVSWKEAQLFISKLNKLTGHRYRLPTEAEWEFAARGGNVSKGYQYSGGDVVADVAWYAGNSGGKCHPVGKKKPNEIGLYDMTGNVWEWCSDWYNKGQYTMNAESNPSGPAKGKTKVIRGGSFDYNEMNCRVSIRNSYAPEVRDVPVGFRLVEDL